MFFLEKYLVNVEISSTFATQIAGWSSGSSLGS